MTGNISVPDDKTLLSTKAAAAILGVIPRRVRQYINEGRLPATKIGQQWVIRREDLIVFAEKPRSAGRPPKSKNGRDSTEST